MPAQRRASELLHVDSDRGELVAAGVAALATLVYFLNTRFDDTWGQGIHLVYTAAAAGAVIAMAALSARGESRPPARPPAWQSTLFVASFVLALAALATLADVLGAEDILESSGTIVWIGLLLTGLMAWFATQRDSGISTLLAAATLAVVVLAFVDWVFDPDSVDTFRWILLLIAVGFSAAAAVQRGARPAHAVGFVNVAGLAVLALALTFAVEALIAAIGFVGDGGGIDAGTGWELVVLVGGAVLIVYAALERQSGPGYLGVFTLLAFVGVAGGPGEDGASLIGWPIVLGAATAGLLAMGLRSAGPSSGVPSPAAPGPSDSPTRPMTRPDDLPPR